MRRARFVHTEKRFTVFQLLPFTWLILAVTFPAKAQDYRGRVQGIVTDSSQAAVAHAKITLSNVYTGVESVKTTDAAGAYLFDFVLPGTYGVAAEAAGFTKFVREKVQVLTRGDVTVNVSIEVGDLKQTITVAESAFELQFNTSTMAQTVQGTMLDQLPVLARNPFTLALLDPAVVNEYWDVEHRYPFYMWSSNGLDVGGDTAGHNDLLLDGIPLGVASRGSYMPPMDAVREVAVEQNSVDAEFGFSAGGTLNVSMKSGTNEYHGTAYYFGRNPVLNALANRVDRSTSSTRNHIWGGTLGGPTIKNKLFTFFSYEQWKTTEPISTVNTLPTDAEKAGDFSQALTPDGSLRPIYDPFSTKFDAMTNMVTRVPFPGNVIPRDRIDPTGQMMVNNMWGPNNPGDDPTRVNNYRNSWTDWTKYWNFSNRTDFNINEKWRLYTRFSKFQTRGGNPNWAGTIASSAGTWLMDALNAGADVLYQPTPHTVINLRYGATYVEDDNAPENIGAKEWANLWPNNNWYQPLLSAVGNNAYYPYTEFDGVGNASGGTNSWYQVHERQHNYQINVSHDKGIHHLKIGQTLRYDYEQNANPNPGGFFFNFADTARTFLNPDPAENGDPYATALLGSISSPSFAGINSPYNIHEKQWAAYVQDDIKLTRRVTLNLGLRYEYETAPIEEGNQFSRYLDLTHPIPEMQANPPKIPANIARYVRGGYKLNGAWIFSDNQHRGLYHANPHIFLPRVGIAVRINDKTALRAGWARYAVPVVTLHPEGDNVAIYGYSRSTPTAPAIAGVPGAIVSNPFPVTNPVLPPTGKTLGRYQNLGDTASWFWQDLDPPVNDRINFSIQRTLPLNILLDTTFFMSYGRRIIPNGPSTMFGTNGFRKNLNMVNPNLIYTLQGQTDQAVPNPFYHYLNADTFPGYLGNQEMVPMRQLLRTYPQYEDFSEMFIPGFHSHYKALQIRAERAFKGGVAFTFGYNYNHQHTQNWFNDLAQYADIAQSQPGAVRVSHTQWFRDQWPRHRVSAAGTWELPIGRGRKYFPQMHPLLDAIVGGWQTSYILVWSSGDLLGNPCWSGNCYLNQMIAPATTPKVYRRHDQWFDTSGFAIAPPYTPRTNPWYYPGLYGPRNWSLDSTLVKFFPIRERMKLEFRVEGYNAFNHFLPTDPVTDITSPNFGKSTNQRNYGRQIQYTARLNF
jgi:outer membrane receptor protein involved in Fe transport